MERGKGQAGYYRLRLRLRLRREMEVVGRAEAFLVAEEFEEVGVKLGGGADEVAEGRLDDGAEGFGGEIECGEPAADGEADAEGGVELGGDAVEGGGLLTDEAAELGQGAAGDIEMEGAAEEEALALVVGHEDEVGVVFLIEPEAGEDSLGGLPAFELPVQGLEDEDEGIKGGGRGGLHHETIAQPLGQKRSGS